jgi:hypothetical protein
MSMVFTYNPSLGESQVQGQPGLHSKTLSQKKILKITTLTTTKRCQPFSSRKDNWKYTILKRKFVAESCLPY